MGYKSSLVIIFLITLLNAKAQTTFQKAYGGTGTDIGNSIEITTDGGYIIGGYSTSFGNGSEDALLIKIDANGNQVWSKTYGGTSSDRCYNVKQTADNGYIFTGYTESSGQGSRDVSLVKTDNSGNILWSKTYGTNLCETAVGLAITNDGYIVTGYQGASSCASGGDIYVVRVDNAGNTLWANNYNSCSFNTDNSFNVIQTADGGFNITGWTYCGSGQHDPIVLKLTGNGTPAWQMQYGSSGDDYGCSIIQTPGGGYIVAGEYQSAMFDAYIFKTDSSGTLAWSKSYGGNGAELFYDIKTTSDNKYIAAGRTNSFGAGGDDAFLVKTDTSGNLIWSKTYGGSANDDAIQMHQTADGGFVLCGTTMSFGAGGQDIYIIKTDANGNIDSANCHTSSPTIVTNIPTPTVINSVSVITPLTVGTDDSPILTTITPATNTVCALQSNENSISCIYKCLGDTTLFSLLQTSGIDSVLWYFNDTLTGAMDTSFLFSPTHIFSTTGTYNVTAFTYADSTIDTLFL